jgi:hypothetical protein
MDAKDTNALPSTAWRGVRNGFLAFAVSGAVFVALIVGYPRPTSRFILILQGIVGIGCGIALLFTLICGIEWLDDLNTRLRKR